MKPLAIFCLVLFAAVHPARASDLWSMGHNESGQLGDGTFEPRLRPVFLRSDVVQAASGQYHTLFLKHDGTLWALGGNDQGQLGDGTRERRGHPVMVATNVAQIAAGVSHSLFVKADGSLWAMGWNYYGELGDGTNAQRLRPVLVTTDVIQAAAGSHHSLFVKTDGTLWSMGSNESGALGDGTYIHRPSPVPVATGVIQAAAGWNHSLFVKSNGTLWGMGRNEYGALGDGTSDGISTPIQVATDVRLAAAGEVHSLFVKTDGSLWAMGSSWAGQLGDGSTTSRRRPVQVASDIATVAAGLSHSLFVRVDGTLWGMGYNGRGQLGDGTTTNRLTPIQIAREVTHAASGAASESTFFFQAPQAPTITVHPQDIEVCVGEAATITVAVASTLPPRFQWYIGSTGDTSQPVEGAALASFSISPPISIQSYWVRVTTDVGSVDSQPAIIEVSGAPVLETQPASQTAALGDTFALSVRIAGASLAYQWYEGSAGDTSTPVDGATSNLLVLPTPDADAIYWVRISNPAGAVDSTAAAITSTSKSATDVVSMGFNSGGQLGDGSTESRWQPEAILTRAVQVAASETHSLMVGADGTLWVAGTNGYGQLGTGDLVWRLTPTPVDSEVVQTTASQNHSLYLKRDGTLFGMGTNWNGELGEAGYGSHRTPVQIASRVAQVSTGETHSLFVKVDGTLWAMGNNWRGKLGDGTETPRTTPVKVATGVIHAAAGGSHSLFLKQDGTLWGMGDNYYRQLGAGANTARLLPVVIASDVVRFAAGKDHTLFVKADGTLWATGAAGEGQLGDGSYYAPDTPAQVATGVVHVSAGPEHSLFLKADRSLWGMGNNEAGQLGREPGAAQRVPVLIAHDAGLSSAGGQHSLFLQEPQRATIIAQPISSVVAFGAFATLSVQARATQELGFQWYLGTSGDSSHPIEGATASSFTTAPITETTRYWVRISTPAGFTDSETATVEPTLAPTIARQPVDTSVPAGKGAVLIVSATGGGLSYQWYSDDPGNTLLPVSGATGATFVVPPLRTSARFWVRVSNPAGSVDSLAVQVLVTPPVATDAWAMGANGSGQLGDGTTSTRYRPVLAASGVAKVAAGYSHSLLLKSDGSLWAMGDNSKGQLCKGWAGGIEKTPVRVAEGVVDVAAGSFFSLFVKSDGTLWAVGTNSDGQLGDHSRTDRTAPVQVASGVARVVAGGEHSLYITTDGTLWGAGSNSAGQLGDAYFTPGSAPVIVASGVARVATSSPVNYGYHTLFVKTDGTLWTMGANGHGQLGDGTTTSRRTPVLIATEVAEVAVGDYHSAFIKTDGTLWTVGSGGAGQLCSGTTADRTVPLQVASGVAHVSAGALATLFSRFDGSLRVAGNNYRGQLGLGSEGLVTTPLPVANGAAGASTFNEHSLFLRMPSPFAPDGTPFRNLIPVGHSTVLQIAPDGVLPMTYRWYRGPLGDISTPVQEGSARGLTTPALYDSTDYWVRAVGPNGTAEDVAVKVEVTAIPGLRTPLFDVTVQAGSAPLLRVDATGAGLSYQWYRGASGDTSSPLDGAIHPRLVLPPHVSTASYWVRITNVAGAFDSNTVTVTVTPSSASDLTVVGSNSDGQLGDDTTTLRLRPAAVAMDVAVLAPTRSNLNTLNTFFLKTDGTLWGMGSNRSRVFGDIHPESILTPLLVTSGIVDVSTQGDQLFYVKQDGTLWGTGQFNGTTSGTPFQITSGVARVWAGGRHTVVLKFDGTLWAFGDNYYGQLGVDSPSDSIALPALVARDVVDAAAGGYHTLFIKSDGTLWAAGANFYGQLGDGTTQHRDPAVQVAEGVVEVAAGTDHSLFIKADGTLWGMGSSYGGQLGSVSGQTATTPVQLASEVAQCDAGHSHTVFMKTDGTLWVMGSRSYALPDTETTGGNLGVPFMMATDVSTCAAGQGCTLYLQRPRPPEILVQPEGTVIAAGHTATLFVEAAGIRSMSYQWYSGPVGDTSHPLAGATASTLTTPALASTRAFWVRVSNAAGTTDSTAAQVVVTLAPTITTQPTRPWGFGGRNAALHVGGTGAGLAYQWYLGASGDISSPVDGATGAMLVLRETPPGASYWVRITNPAGTVDSISVALSIAPVQPCDLVGMGSNALGQLGLGETANFRVPTQVFQNVLHVSMGPAHTALITIDGRLWTAGSNRSGALGDGTYSSRDAFAPVRSDVQSVSAGTDYTLFVTTDGTLWGCGENGYSQLGDGTVVDRKDPVSLATEVATAVAGESLSLFIKTDGTLWGLGGDFQGILGFDAYTSTPVQIAEGVVSAVIGTGHVLFLKDDGSLWGAGSNAFGQLGLGSVNSTRDGPVEIARDVMAVAAGGRHSVFVKRDGTLWGMGSNTGGQLGLPVSGSVRSPVQIAMAVAGVAAAGSHSVYLGADGVLRGMGSNSLGQLGADRPSLIEAPVEIAADVSTAFAGQNGTAYVKVDGTLWAMGGGSSGQMGADRLAWRSLPALIRPGVVQVAAASQHTVLLQSDGTAWSVGLNLYGQLGDGTTDNRSTSVRVATGIAQVSVGSSFSMLITNEGRLLTAGLNASGQLGDGTHNNRADYTEIATSVAEAAGGTSHMLFIKSDGTLWGSGSNSSRQLGLASTVSRTAPVMVMEDAATVACGANHSLVVKRDGTLWTAGNNTYGQLGVEPAGASSVFVQIASGVVQAAAGSYHSVFLKRDGTLWIMGYHGFSRFGEAPLVFDGEPKLLATDVVDVSAGHAHTVFLKAEGSVWSVGLNVYGELGNGATTACTSPGRIATGATSVAAGGLQSFYLQHSEGVQPPTILVQPTNRDLAQGETALFEVAASGIPDPLIYRWERLPADGSTWASIADGGPFAGAGTPVLSVTPDTAALDGDRFRCVVSNGAPPAAISDEAALAVTGDASVVLRGLDRIFDGTQKSAAVFTVPAGLAVDVRYSGSITPPVTPGRYTVAATVSEPGYSGSATATLVIAPRVQLQTASTIVQPSGARAELTVNFGGGQASVQWQFRRAEGVAGMADGVIGLNGGWVDVPGATGTSLIIPVIQQFQGGNYRAVVTINGVATVSDLVTVTVEAPTISPEARLQNLSTRALCLTGDGILIPGFVISGTGTKQVLIRGVGPRLAQFGVADPLADPFLTLKRDTGNNNYVTIATNDDWGTNDNKAGIITAAAAVGAFSLIDGSKDSALLVDLPAGIYSVPTGGVDGATGVSIVELYDTDPGSSTTRLTNISNRGFVDVGDKIMIPGFVVSEEGSRTFLIRAVGPRLANFGVLGALADPELTVFQRDAQGANHAILANDDWGVGADAATTASTAAAVGAFSLGAGSKDAAFVVTLPPGIYTVNARGKDGSTGVALVEVYLVP